MSSPHKYLNSLTDNNTIRESYGIKLNEIIMKTMTCIQLGGACDKEFHASTFDEMEAMSKQHGMEMFQKGDEAHLNAMKKIKELIKSPEDMKNWFDSKRKEFDALPDN